MPPVASGIWLVEGLDFLRELLIGARLVDRSRRTEEIGGRELTRRCVGAGSRILVGCLRQRAGAKYSGACTRVPIT